MPSYPIAHDVGSILNGNFGGFTSITAGGGNDGAEQNGPWIDTGYAESCVIYIGFETTLSDSATLDIASNIQEASDSSGTNSADYGSAVSQKTVATGASGGSTENGIVVMHFRLRPADKFIRVQYTGTMSASSGDTANLMVIAAFSGQDELPSSNQDN